MASMMRDELPTVRKEFKDGVDEALSIVRKILDTQRIIGLPEDIEHDYQCKYKQVDQITNMSIIAIFNALREIGITKELLQDLRKNHINPRQPIILHFQGTACYKFLKGQTKEIEMEEESERRSEEYNEETTIMSFITKGLAVKSKTGTKKKYSKPEFHWNVTMDWKLSLIYHENQPETSDSSTVHVSKRREHTLQSRSTSQSMITESPSTFYLRNSKHSTNCDEQVDLSFFIEQIDMVKLQTIFEIDQGRNATTTKTPFENPQLKGAIECLKSVQDFMERIMGPYFGLISKIEERLLHEMNLADTDCSPSIEIFIPVQPLLIALIQPSTNEFSSRKLESPTTRNNSLLALPQDGCRVHGLDKESPILRNEVLYCLFNEQIRSIQNCIRQLNDLNKSLKMEEYEDHLLLTVKDRTLMSIGNHIGNICKHYLECIQYLEQVLEDQFVAAAAGRYISSVDIDNFMKHQIRYTLPLDPRPQPFCYLLGRQNCINRSSIGTLSIQTAYKDKRDGKCAPQHFSIDTLVHSIPSMRMQVPLDTESMANFMGPLFLHGWMRYRFGNSPAHHLVAKAKSLSSFALVLGTIKYADGITSVIPKDAIILSDQDQIIIPLLLEELPTAKEFKDAIYSLSPEQQQFAKKIRSIQMASSIFCIGVIDIRPAIEDLLKLPSNSLTKEVELTTEVSNLLKEFPALSDMICYDGDPSLCPTDKIREVKENVKNVTCMIHDEKMKQSEASALSHQYQRNEVIGFDSCDSSVSNGVKLREKKLLDLLEKADQLSTQAKMFHKKSTSLSSNQSIWSNLKITRNFGRVQPQPVSSSPNPSSTPTTITPLPLSSADKQTTTNIIKATSDAAKPLSFQAETSNTLTTSNFFTEKELSATTKTAENTRRFCNHDNQVKDKVPALDITQIPSKINNAVEQYPGGDIPLRPTTIETRYPFIRHQKGTMLSKSQSLPSPSPSTTTSSFHKQYSAKDISQETQMTLDLLDALSKSADKSIPHSEWHVLFPVTYGFEKDDVMETILKDDIDPISRLESSMIFFHDLFHNLFEK